MLWGGGRLPTPHIRATTPHAIANRLAKQALQAIPKNVIMNAFLICESERLLQSFTHRLSYLHDSTVAAEIVSDWLKPDGWLGETNCNFNSLGLTVFKNIAPIIPEAVLSMLERAASGNSEEAFILGSDGHRREFIRLLQHLAYEPELFERSTKILCRCALLEKSDINDNGSARSILKALFHIGYSGTHAPLQIRANIVNELVNSDIQFEAELGTSLLEAALQTHHFYPANISNFGARSRDFGYWPKSKQEIYDWYERFVGICNHLSLSEKSVALEAKRVFANNLRGLWLVGENNGQNFLEMLVNSAAQVHKKQAWNEGWIAVKGILRYDDKQMPKESLDRLRQFEKSLRPANLLEQARTYALTEMWLNFDLEDDYDENEGVSSHWERVQKITKELGTEVVQETDTFKTILPELVTNYGYRLKIFGTGLADGCKDRQKIWQMLYTQLEKTSPEKRQIAVLLGFLSSCAEHDPNFYNTILDGLVEDGMLGQWFPHFQTASAIDARGIERLHRSLDGGKLHISSFQYLAWGDCHESINDDSLAALVQKIATKDGGVFVAIEILKTRFHKSKDEPVEFSHHLVAVGRDVISNFPYDEVQNGNNHPDYDLAQIAKVCLGGQYGVEAARKICKTLAEGFQDRILTFDYPHLLSCMAQIHPYVFLDVFLESDEIRFHRMTFDDLERDDNPVNQIPDNILLDWCEKAPETRYDQLAFSLQTYWRPQEAEELSWKPIVYSLIEKSPNIQEVLSSIQNNISPTSWSGSLADVLEKRLVLFTALYHHKDPTVREWSKEQNLQLQSAIKKQRESELRENQKRFERFE